MERKELLAEQETILNTDIKTLTKHEREEQGNRMNEITERLGLIEADTAPTRAAEILMGLGFSETDLSRNSDEFSGGWRMRISLAKALFCNPDLLMLDEPTNHLDLDAVMWLEDYIMSLDITVIVVSHAREFLNNVSEEIIYFANEKLEYYRGNFTTFEKVRAEKIRQNKKQLESQSMHMSHLQDFIDKFRANAKRATLVQSRIKALNRIDIVDEIAEDPTCVFIFPNPEKLGPPLLRLNEAVVGYEPGKPIVSNATLDIGLESRIAVVGPNGAGKTTLLKALTKELDLFEGYSFIHNRLRVGLFSQHHVDQLDLRLSAIEQMMETFGPYETDAYRNHLGSFGLSGNLGIRPMYLLSGGQKSRVAFAMVTWKKPHILVMDEPTNHLDIDAVNALIIALNSFQGGLVIVSHDQHFVGSLCNEIYVVNHGKCDRFKGSFDDYKKQVQKDIRKKAAKRG